MCSYVFRYSSSIYVVSNFTISLIILMMWQSVIMSLDNILLHILYSWSKPEWAHIYIVFVNFVCLSVSPYIHNARIYKCSNNLRSTFNCWLQNLETCFVQCFVFQHSTNTLWQTNIQVINLRSKFIDLIISPSAYDAY